MREVADGVESGVGAQAAQHARAVVAHGPEVKLLRPARGMVHEGKLVEEGRAELVTFQGREWQLASSLGEGVADLLVGVRLDQDPLEAVIADAATDPLEEVVALLKCHQ